MLLYGVVDPSITEAYSVVVSTPAMRDKCPRVDVIISLTSGDSARHAHIYPQARHRDTASTSHQQKNTTESSVKHKATTTRTASTYRRKVLEAAGTGSETLTRDSTRPDPDAFYPVTRSGH